MAGVKRAFFLAIISAMSAVALATQELPQEHYEVLGKRGKWNRASRFSLLSIRS